MLLKYSNKTLKLISIKELILIEEIEILGNTVDKMRELKLLLNLPPGPASISLKSLLKLPKDIFAHVLIKD